MANDKLDQTVEPNIGGKWYESICERLEYVKRQATTAKPIIAPGLILEISLIFNSEIIEIAQAHESPTNVIINIDQTPFSINIDQTLLPFVLMRNYTLAEKGSSRVSVPGISGTFGVTMAGGFLPLQLIYEGKTKKMPTKIQLPQRILHYPNTKSLENTSIAMLNEILVPYITGKRTELNLQSKPWLLICDVLKGQWNVAARNVVKKSNGKMAPFPNHWINYF